MGTRSMTYVVDGETPLVAMYGQMDGYISGWGSEIAKFLDGKSLTNGLGDGFNGIGDLATRLITHLKTVQGGADTPGQFYLCPPNAGQEEEYNYYVTIKGDYWKDLANCSIQVTVNDWEHKEIFRGSPAELLNFEEVSE